MFSPKLLGLTIWVTHIGLIESENLLTTSNLGLHYFENEDVTVFTTTKSQRVEMRFTYPTMSTDPESCNRTLNEREKNEILLAEIDFAQHMSEVLSVKLEPEALSELKLIKERADLKEVDCNTNRCDMDLQLDFHDNERWLKPLTCYKSVACRHLGICCSLNSRLNYFRAEEGCPSDPDTIVKLRQKVTSFYKASGERRSLANYCIMPTAVYDIKDNSTMFEISNKPNNVQGRILPGENPTRNRRSDEIKNDNSRVNFVALIVSAIWANFKYQAGKLWDKTQDGVIGLLENDVSHSRRRRSGLLKYYESGGFLSNHYNEHRLNSLRISLDENASKIREMAKLDKMLVIQMNHTVDDIQDATYKTCRVVGDITREVVLLNLKQQQASIEKKITDIHESCARGHLPEVIRREQLMKLCSVTEGTTDNICNTPNLYKRVSCAYKVTSGATTSEINVMFTINFYVSSIDPVMQVITSPVAVLDAPVKEKIVDSQTKIGSSTTNMTNMTSEPDATQVLNELITLLKGRNRRSTENVLVEKRFPYFVFHDLPDYFIKINGMIIGLYRKNCVLRDRHAFCPLSDNTETGSLCLAGILNNEIDVIKEACNKHTATYHAAQCVVSSHNEVNEAFGKNVLFVTSHEKVNLLGTTDLYQKSDNNRNCQNSCVFGLGSEAEVHLECQNRIFNLYNGHNIVEVQVQTHPIRDATTRMLKDLSIRKFNALNLVTGYASLDRKLQQADPATVRRTTWWILGVVYVLITILTIGLVLYSCKLLGKRIWIGLKRKIDRMRNIYRPRQLEDQLLEPEPQRSTILRGR